MKNRNSPLDPQVYLRDIFASQAVAKGSVIRRSKRDIERFVGMDAFFAEIKRRGFQVVENADQFIIFCNREPIRRRA